MNIGIIGLGVVGTACKNGFASQGHDVLVHDIKLGTNIVDIIGTDIVYVCIPTPISKNGTCDLSELRLIVQQLKTNLYSGVIAIKSTVPPGTTQQLLNETSLNICFVPEFLREWCATDDFINNHKLLAIGCNTQEVFEISKKSHGSLPETVCRLTPTEAEILKYYSNVFNALRVTFANKMFELCQMLGADYNTVKETYLIRKTATQDYMDCSDDLRGYGGLCLPKDTKVLMNVFAQLGLDLELISAIDKDNAKFKKTVPTGMRDCL
jgi:UDPglucose 6-dehydrogenase